MSRCFEANVPLAGGWLPSQLLVNDSSGLFVPTPPRVETGNSTRWRPGGHAGCRPRVETAHRPRASASPGQTTPPPGGCCSMIRGRFRHVDFMRQPSLAAWAQLPLSTAAFGRTTNWPRARALCARFASGDWLRVRPASFRVAVPSAPGPSCSCLSIVFMFVEVLRRQWQQRGRD